MLVSFAMIPLDKGPHFSQIVARSLKIIKKSGLPHELNAMSTIIEGDWDEVMDVINRCRLEMRKDSGRVSIKIWIDDKAGTEGMLEGKVKSVAEILNDA
jgi:uncharacterized protein (TIGR00106 family)